MTEVIHPHSLPRSFTTPTPTPGTHAHAHAHFSVGGRQQHASHSMMSQQHVRSLEHSQGHTSSNYSMQSQPSSRSSDTTQGTAHSTLFPAPPLPSNASSMTSNGSLQAGGAPYGPHASSNDMVTATDNVMNSVADASSSLFQICVSLRQRLMGVPGILEIIDAEEDQADEDTDPVTLLWRTFRRGYPLMLLYNTLRPTKPLDVEGVRDDKRGKAATFKFLQACVNDLKFPAEECFIVTDLYGDDTTGFVKVARVVNRVLDILVQRGLVDDIRPTASDFEQAEKGMKRTQRQHIISELVTTERTYVQHLELLQAFKHLVEERGVIPGDAVHDIFLNLNSLLDFQRRFLIRVEQTNAIPEEEQNWGKLFVLYCEAFKVYEPYIANQRKCEKTVVAEFVKLQVLQNAAQVGGVSNELRQMVESSNTLYSFLMKPFQRLSKYPLLLEDLWKKGDLDEERREDLRLGKEAATSVLTRTNKAVDREEKAEAVQELKMRVEDWKGHRVEGFGELLLYGTFTVLKSENLGSGKDGERQYHVYLFETILLCCKDIDPSKPKNKLSNKPLVDKRGKPKLQLKGRIFMQNVTDLVSLAKPGMDDIHLRITSSQKIFWKGDPSIENFIIRFNSEDHMKKWAQQIESQRRRYRDPGSHAPGPGGGVGRASDGSARVGTSVTEFTYLQNQPQPKNPYLQQGEEEEEDEDDTMVSSQHSWAGSGSTAVDGYPYGNSKDVGSQSRNGSTSSLRSRSTTGESGGGVTPTGLQSISGRQAPPRFAQGTLAQQPAPLTLRTRELASAAVSPGGREMAQDSYFSPTTGLESPMTSSRTSSSSGMGMYPFPRQQLPAGQNGYYDEGHGGHSRFTAPAMGRSAPQQQQQQHRERELSGGYGGPGGPHGRPGVLPRQNGSAMHSAQQMPLQPRHRSASSPDMNNQRAGGPVSGTALRNGGAGGVPAVPDVPAPYQQHPHMAPRSQSNSPAAGMMMNGNTGGLAMARGAAGSPQQLQRDRSYQMRQPQDPSPTAGYGYDGRGSETRGLHSQFPSARNVTPVPPPGGRGTFSPGPPLPPTASTTPAIPPTPFSAEAPTQLKVKVHCPSASQVLTLVVPLNITYQSLKDRIDAKLQRSTNLTLGDKGGEGKVKLKYLDEDDYVSIQSDEDVQTAFETWREQKGGDGGGDTPTTPGMMGEIELFCQR